MTGKNRGKLRSDAGPLARAFAKRPAPYRACQCGADFCEDCGDCLRCYGADDCPVTGRSHSEQLAETEEVVP